MAAWCTDDILGRSPRDDLTTAVAQDLNALQLLVDVGGLYGLPLALNMVKIFSALADRSVPEVLQAYGGQGFGAFKQALGELLVDTMAPISARFTALLEDREALDAILARGAARARQIAGPTLERTYQALGLVRG